MSSVAVSSDDYFSIYLFDTVPLVFAVFSEIWNVSHAILFYFHMLTL